MESYPSGLHRLDAPRSRRENVSSTTRGEATSCSSPVLRRNGRRMRRPRPGMWLYSAATHCLGAAREELRPPGLRWEERWGM